MSYKGTVTLYAPDGEKVVWHVSAEPVVKDGCCTFMQEKDGMRGKVRVMGTIVTEAFDMREEGPARQL